MKVILLQDVAKIGKRAELVEVPNGYALNQLIPKRMAEPATAANKKRIEKQQATAAAHQAEDQERFAAAKEAMLATTLQVPAEANELGHTFKGVSERDIATAAEAAGVSVDPGMIVLGAPIKEVGDHEIALRRGDDTAMVTVAVVKSN